MFSSILIEVGDETVMLMGKASPCRRLLALRSDSGAWSEQLL